MGVYPVYPGLFPVRPFQVTASYPGLSRYTDENCNGTQKLILSLPASSALRRTLLCFRETSRNVRSLVRECFPLAQAVGTHAAIIVDHTTRRVTSDSRRIPVNFDPPNDVLWDVRPESGLVDLKKKKRKRKETIARATHVEVRFRRFLEFLEFLEEQWPFVCVYASFIACRSL